MKRPTFLAKWVGAALIGMAAFDAYAANVTVTLRSSSGAPIANAAVLQHAGGWTSFGTTDANGQATKSLTGNYSFQVQYNHTSVVTAVQNLPAVGNVNIDVYTTTVTVKGHTNDGTALQGITNTYYSGGFRSLGTTDVNGNASIELFPGTYNFTSSYNNTSNVQSVTVAGDGFTAGQTTDIHTYLSKVSFTASSYSGALVSGVSVMYYAGSGWKNLPATDVNGETSTLMYPGTYTTFKASYKGTSKEFSVTVPGDGKTVGQQSSESLQLTRVQFFNAGSVSYYNGGWYFISGPAYYMFPGTVELHIGGYSRDVEITGLNFEKVASVLILKDHNGNLLDIDGARGGAPAINYHVLGAASNQSNGVWIDIANKSASNSRVFEVRKNGSISTKTQDVTVNNVYNFQTNLMTLRLQTCAGTGIEGGTIRYGAGANISSHWGSNTDANGEATKELFPGAFIVEMNVNQSTETKNVVLSGNDVFNWYTTTVKLHYPGNIAYGGAGTTAHFSATKEAEMLPGTVNFSFRNNGENIVPLTIPASTPGNCLIFEKTPIIARLLSSTNAPIAGGTAEFFQGSWQNFYSATQANGNAVGLMQGKVTSTITARMNYAFTTLTKYFINLASVNNVIEFNTVNTTMTLVDANGSPIEGNTLEYYGSNAWRVFGSGVTSGGSESMELLPGTYSFAMRLNGTRLQKSSQNLNTTPTIAFQASRVNLQLVDGSNSPIQGGAAEYYASGWISMGTTDANGLSQPVDIFPGTYTFRMTKTPYSQQKSGVAINQLFQTVVFVNNSSSSARMVRTGSAEAFSFYPNPATSALNIVVGADNADVVIYAADGRIVHHQTYASGMSTIDIAAFASGSYLMQVKHGAEMESFKFTKQ